MDFRLNRPIFYRFSFSVANKGLGGFTVLAVFFFVTLITAPAFGISQKTNGYEAVKLQSLAIFESQSGKDLSQISPAEMIQFAQAYQEIGDFTRSQGLIEKARPFQAPALAAKLNLLEAKNLFFLGGKENLLKVEKLSSSNKSSNSLSAEEQNELGYLGVLAAINLGHADEAQRLANAVSKDSQFSIYAYSALAENALQKKMLDQAIQFFSQIDSRSLSKSARDTNIFSLSRLNLAKALNAKNLFPQAKKVLEDVSSESDIYPEALMVKAYLNLQIDHPEKYIESVTYLSRAMSLVSTGTLFYQASLLTAFCFSKLGAVQKGSGVLDEGLKQLDAEFAENKRLSVDAGYFDEKFEDALARYLAGKSPSATSESRPSRIALSSTFQHWVPRVSRLRVMREENQKNILDLKFLVVLLGQNDFDPSLLKKPGIDSLFLALDRETVQQQAVGNPMLATTFGRARDLYALLSLGRVYADFLVEGRKWDVTKQFLVQNAISARIKKMRSLGKQKSVIQEFFAGRNTVEPPAVSQLKLKIAQNDKAYFLEEKKIQDARSILSRLNLAERKMDEVGRYSKIIFSPEEMEKYQGLRKQIAKQKEEAVQALALFETDKANKSWRSVTEQVAIMLNPEELKGIEKEIEGAKIFIAGIQKEDEKAKEEFSADLGGIQRKLDDQTQVLLRTLYLETAKGLLMNHQQIEIRLAATERDFRKGLRREFLAEMTEENGKLLQFQSQIRFERARLSDLKTAETRPSSLK